MDRPPSLRDKPLADVWVSGLRAVRGEREGLPQEDGRKMDDKGVQGLAGRSGGWGSSHSSGVVL